MSASLDAAPTRTDSDAVAHETASSGAAASHITRRQLPTAGELRRALPLGVDLARQIEDQRQAIRDILAGRDDRLLVVVGPCSIHDPQAALEYARRLAALSAQVSDRLLLVMRVYVEKPRTTVGWKGLAYDPDLDGSDDMARGLEVSRELMREITALGLPVATELLQPMLAPYLEDLLAWVAIGARTTESQLHRELASGLDAVVGFKNATGGDIGVVLDAMRAAAHPHSHFGLDPEGRPVVQQTVGNAHTHLVLRGGHGEPNYQTAHVQAARRALEEVGLTPRMMVDCSHANARKDHRRQSQVFLDVLAQRLGGETALFGLMIESHLHEGKQALAPGRLRHGVSVTDACIGWETTEHLLQSAAERLR